MDPKKQPITNDILKVKFGFFDTARDMSLSLLDESSADIRVQGSSYISVYNTLSWDRDGIVTLSPQQSINFNSVTDENGKAVLCQKLSSGELVFTTGKIPAFGSVVFILKEKKAKNSGNIATDYSLDNGIIKVTADPQSGDISELVSSGYNFADNKAASQLNSYRYLHGEDPPEKASAAKNIRISVKENGPLLATLQILSDAEGCRSLCREITLIKGQSYVEICNIVDKVAVTEKEGIHFGFGFNIPTPVTRFDIPWGIVEMEKDQLAAGNRNWMAFQRWLDISNNERGVTFCSLDAPMFENATITANVLGAATNSPRWIRKLEPSSTIYSWALNNHWHTNFPLSQEGIVSFRYRIFPHDSGYDPVISNRFGLEQSQPLIAVPAKKGIRFDQPFTISGSDKVYVTIIKAGSEGESVKIRLRSVSSEAETIKINWKMLKPSAVYLNRQKTGNEITVPAMGFVNLELRN
jgi:alpha-mannosidase